MKLQPFWISLMLASVGFCGSKSISPPPTPQDSSLRYSLGGHFIYWQAIEKDLEIAEVILAADGGNVLAAKELNTDFLFFPGFQIDVGLENSDIATRLQYTWLHGTTSSTIPTPSGAVGLASYWNLAGEYSAIQHAWTLRYDTLSWQIERNASHPGTWQALPYLGVKGGWISQKILERATPLGQTNSVTASFDSSSWMAGPGVGFRNTIDLGSQFSFNLGAELYILYQHFNVSFHNQQPANPAVLVTDRETLGYLTPNANLFLNFLWSSPVWKKGYHMDLAAGYNFLYYWNQNMCKRIRAILYGSDAGDLMLQGLNLSATLYW